MRAAVLTGPGRLQVQNVDRLEPKAGQVRIRLEGCGVCASNLVPWAGRAGAFGHERRQDGVVLAFHAAT
jgi:D-arabinose 1-dehydrogenase-like Zn-dependent alcohol dehydrogenase